MSDQIELMPAVPAAPRVTYADRKRAVASRFVRDHVAEIIKKSKTVASARTKRKQLLLALASSGEKDGSTDIQHWTRQIEAAEKLIAEHYTALIERTEIR